MANMKAPAPTYAEAVKTIRNRLRLYSAASIVDQALKRLDSVSGKPIYEQMQVLPWIVFLLVKLVLEDKMTPLDKGQFCPKELFDQCCNELWNAHDSRYTLGGQERSNKNVYLMIRSYIQSQIPFQKAINFDFIRWPALISRLDPDHPTRQLFLKRFGMSPDNFSVLCYALHAPALNNTFLFNIDFFQPLRPYYGTSLDLFLNEFSRDLFELRAELRLMLDARLVQNKPARPVDEPHEFPWIAKYPLLRLPGQRFRVWHPQVFARGMESAVHKRLSECGQVYSQHFSGVFEDYVLELISEAGISYIGEKDYKDVVGADKNAVEAIVTYAGTNVLIEAKMTAYSESLLISESEGIVWKGLKRILGAMRQAWEVSSKLRSSSMPDWDCTRAKADFLVIVTSQPISSSSGEHLKRLFTHYTLEPSPTGNPSWPTQEQLAWLPLKHIIITSIDEFEHLIGCVINGEIDLVDFLREVAVKNHDPSSSAMFIDQFLSSKTKAWRLPNVLKRATIRAEDILARILSAPYVPTHTDDSSGLDLQPENLIADLPETEITQRRE